MIRENIKAAQIAAMKAGDKARSATLRLILSALKNRDIELRGSDKIPEDDVLVTEVMQKMIKQRRESADMYEKGGRAELADAERSEISVIEEFLPRQLSDEEAAAAIHSAIAEAGATTAKDMGAVMAILKQRHGSQLDMSKASGLVRISLQ